MSYTLQYTYDPAPIPEAARPAFEKALVEEFRAVLLIKRISITQAEADSLLIFNKAVPSPVMEALALPVVAAVRRRRKFRA